MSDLVVNQEHRARMDALEAAILAECEPLDLEIRHYFADGTYTREMILPQGAVVTGRIHKTSTVNILTKGRMRVVTDEGEYEVAAPHVFVSGAGVKKAGHALEDSIWINVFPWDGIKTADEMVEALSYPSYAALEHDLQEKLCHL
jgi:hypothetical protein